MSPDDRLPDCPAVCYREEEIFGIKEIKKFKFDFCSRDQDQDGFRRSCQVRARFGLGVGGCVSVCEREHDAQGLVGARKSWKWLAG